MEARAKKFSQGCLWGNTLLILVITGTDKKPFNRLIKAVDEIAKLNRYDFLIQKGYSTYSPNHCKYFDFCKNKDFLSYTESADLIISQVGFGSIGHCIKFNKPVILVPKEHKYGESSDKQYELAEYMAGEHDSIICVRDVALLPDAIERLIEAKPVYHYHNCVSDLIDKFIKENFYDEGM